MAPKEIYDLHALFEAVQLQSILEDGKTFVDCLPKYGLEEIERKYDLQKDQPGFDLTSFVKENFAMPPVFGATYESNRDLPVEENIKQLWDVLTRNPIAEESSLIPLPFTYIVPGGRFREIYYWDSYFTMLGLQQHGRVDLIQSMINNFAFLIRTYGHIPNGNRRYYVSRSQPPFFSLMVKQLALILDDEKLILNFKNELEQEYRFWQEGIENAQPGEGYLRVVKMPDGELLNRYYDNNPKPRQESYAEDVHIAKHSSQSAESIYRHIRAGAESGWDFSSRWLADGMNLPTIQTTEIVPVDLNCLMYSMEFEISRAYALSGDMATSAEYESKASQRSTAIRKYCWNNEVGFYCDYNLVDKKVQNGITAAGLFPLFVKIATFDHASIVADNTEAYLLKKGGLVTTTVNTGQQWDAPNGWAPLQWIAFMGLHNYRCHELADEIARRWLALNESVFRETGKLMEKYNVEDLDKPAGGGEYPGQDGFGWTNGIYIALKYKLKK